MNFFTRNCAQTAIIFSRSHVENLLTTLQGIHYTLFPSHSGNFLHFISSILRARFPHLLPADDPQPIPESWLILPLIYGGLGCPVPMLETFALLRAFRENESAKSNPYTPSPTYDLTSERGNFESCLSADRTLYAAYKQQWQERSSYPSNRDLFPLEYGASHKPSFMSFDEYNRGRESQSMYWSATYTHLLSPANPARPDSSSTATARYANWLLQFPRCHDAPFSKTVDGEDEPWRKEWDELESPWDWWFALYAEQQGKMFGGMRVLSPQLMLGGMVRRIGQRAVKFDI